MLGRVVVWRGLWVLVIQWWCVVYLQDYSFFLLLRFRRYVVGVFNSLLAFFKSSASSSDKDNLVVSSSISLTEEEGVILGGLDSVLSSDGMVLWCFFFLLDLLVFGWVVEVDASTSCDESLNTRP